MRYHSHRTQHARLVLRMEQPLVLVISTGSGLLQGGLRHEISFEFTVPPRIIGSVCQHFCHHQQVQEDHSLLPPSLGQCDMTPNEISVDYSMQLSLSRGNNRDGVPAVSEWALPLVIRSPRIELAPLLIPKIASITVSIKRNSYPNLQYSSLVLDFCWRGRYSQPLFNKQKP